MRRPRRIPQIVLVLSFAVLVLVLAPDKKLD